MTALWTGDEIAEATGGTCLGTLRDTNGKTTEIGGVQIDSRRIRKGDLFVALAGERVDGHDYVERAIDDGAALALVSTAWADSHPELTERLPLVAVKDVFEALWDIARAARARSKAKFVGVTGSVGKTGTKEMLALALSRLGRVHKTEGNFNNHIGLPVTLARMPRDTDYAVIEMGMNHAGEIEPLSRLVRPDVAVITTVTAVHLENFDGLAGIAEAKAEIFKGMNKAGTAILNRENAMFHYVRDIAERKRIPRVISFGAHPDADVQVIAKTLGAERSEVKVHIGNDFVEYAIGAPGEHWVRNSLAVLATIHALEGDVVKAVRALGDIRAPQGRGQQVRITLDKAKGGGEITLIDESYNASPASTRAAIEILAQCGGKTRKIAVLGDMLELGRDAESMHAALVSDINRADIDLVLTAGPLMKALHDALPTSRRAFHADSSNDLVAPLLDLVRAGDTVMVKGSLGSRMAVVVDALKGLASNDDGQGTPSGAPDASGGTAANGG